MDPASLEAMEMDDTLEVLLGAVDTRRQIVAAKNTIADLQEALQAEHDERIRLEERLKMVPGGEIEKSVLADTIEELEAAREYSQALSIQVQDSAVVITELRDKLVKLRQPSSVQGRPIGNYTFKSHLHTRPSAVEPNDAFAVTLVAVAGYDKDWTCYMGRAGCRPSEIASHGDKVLENQAGVFAYVMQLRDYRS